MSCQCLLILLLAVFVCSLVLPVGVLQSICYPSWGHMMQPTAFFDLQYEGSFKVTFPWKKITEIIRFICQHFTCSLVCHSICTRFEIIGHISFAIIHVFSISLYLWGFFFLQFGISDISIVYELNFLQSRDSPITYNMLFLVCLAILYLAFQAMMGHNLVPQRTYIWQNNLYTLFLQCTHLLVLCLIDGMF